MRAVRVAAAFGLLLAAGPTPAEETPNLLSNGSFQSDARYWSLSTAGLTAEWNLADSNGSPSSGSLALTAWGTESYESLAAGQCLAVTPGAQYHLSAKVLIPRKDESDPAAEVNLRLTFFDGVGGRLLVTGLDFAETRFWREEDAVVASPAGAATGCVTLMVTNRHASAPVKTFVDDVFFGPVVPSRTLQVTVVGPGSVTSSPAGISCSAAGVSCSMAVPSGTSVVLTASPSAGAVFAGWRGGSTTSPLTLRLDGDVAETATFSACTPLSAPVLLAPADGASEVARSPSYFWTSVPGATGYDFFLDNVYRGTVAGTSASAQTLGYGETHTWWVRAVGGCEALSPSPARFTTVRQASLALSITKVGTGFGSVTGTWGGKAVDCDASSCTWWVVPGTVVTLGASPDTGSIFAGWGTGDCPGATCVLTVSGNRTLNPVFNGTPNPNDSCTSPTLISTPSFTDSAFVSYSTQYSLDPAPPCSPEGRQKSSWYRFRAPAAGILTVDTFGSDFDTVLSAWTGSCGGLSPVGGACNDDSGGTLQSRITFPVTAGTSYLVMASSRGTEGNRLALEARYSPTFGPCASPGFGPAISSANPSGTRQGTFADVDRDGHLDLVATSASGASVLVFRGTGNGAFGAPTAYATGSAPVGVVAGDFNADGWPDLGVVTLSETSVLLGNGAGGFLERRGYSPWGMFISAADLDADGRLDLAVSGSGAVSVLEGDGRGGFHLVANVAGGISPGANLIADFNGDRILDLAVLAPGANRLTIVLGRGAMAFGAPVYYAVPSGPVGLAAADLNLDGNEDLVVSCSNAQSIAVFLGDGKGSFAAAPTISTPGVQHVALAAVDVTGDGRPDLVAGRSNGSAVSAWAGRGDGTFAPPASVPSGLSFCRQVVVADVDENGKPDVVVTDGGSNTVAVLPNTCTQGVPLAVTNVVGSPGPTTGGTPVTILGTGFLPGAAVTFGGIPATNVVVTGATRMTAVTPGFPSGTVAVTVTNPGGETATLPAGFTYCFAPVAAVSGTATICEGASATLRADLLGSPPWSITWSDGVEQTGILASPATRAVFGSVGSPVTYTVTAVTDASACPTGRGTGSAVITVAPASAEITAPSGVCPGARGLRASVPNGGPGATYSWTVSNGSLMSGAGTRTITFDAGASGFVSLAVSVAGASGCRAASQKAVLIRKPNSWQGGGPDGGWGSVLRVDPSAPDVLYAIMGDATYKSVDGARSWLRLILPDWDQAYDLTIDPRNPARLFASNYGSLYVSPDGGATWPGRATYSPSVTGLTSPLLVMPAGPDVIWQGSTNGLYRSTDGGQTFLATGLLSGMTVGALSAGGPSGEVVYAGTTSSGVYKSVDGGATWVAANSGLGSLDVKKLWTSHSSSAVAYAATEAGYYRTTTAGAGWVALGIALTGGDSFTANPSSPATVYAGTFGSGLWRSTDYGEHWTQIAAAGLDLRLNQLAVDPANGQVLYAATMTGVYKSLDGGLTWSRQSYLLNASSADSVALDAGRGQSIYSAGSGGIFRSDDRGATWRGVNRGISDWGSTVLCSDPVTADKLYAVVGLGGFYVSTDRGESWTRLSSTPPGVHAVAVDPSDPSVIYLGHNQLGISRSTDGGATWASRSNGLADGAFFSLAIDPSTSTTIYAGTTGSSGTIFKSMDGGASWVPSSSGLTTAPVTSIVIDPSAPTTLYAGTQGGLFKSTDGGATWVDRTPDPPYPANLVALDPENPAHVFAAGGRSVHESFDAGLTWNSLPDIPRLAVALAAMRGTPPFVVVGTQFAGVLTFSKVSIPSVTSVVPAWGAWRGGDTVTITGHDFGPGAQVVFGNIPAANVTVVDSTTLEVVTPPHAAGVVDVTVTNDGCGSTTAPNAFMYFSSGPDAVVVGSVAARPGDTVSVPVFVRDVSMTPLGGDAGEGMKLQGFAFRAGFSPAGAISAASFAASGIAAARTPIYSHSTAISNYATWVAAFSESTDLLPFRSDPSGPGDEVAALTVTVSPTAAPNSLVSIVLDPAYTRLRNEGNLAQETVGNGYLALGVGRVQVASASDVELRNGIARSETIWAGEPLVGWKYFYVNLPAGVSKAIVSLTGLSGDVDLYTRLGSKPTSALYSCRPLLAGTADETCALTDPPQDVLWIGVNNRVAGTTGFTVRVDWGSEFYSVTPCRVVNTRRSDYPPGLGAPSIGAAGGPDRVLPLTSGTCGIPGTAKAVALNVTVAETAGAGYLTLYPGDAPAPATSTINFAAGQVKANNVFLPLATDGSGTIKVKSGATGTLNVLIDVVGYFD